MKYIRTKEEILKVDGYDNRGVCLIKTNTYDKTYYKEDYIKMADTIEELCDEFVYEFENLKHERCWKGKDTGRWFDYDCDVALTEEQISTIKGAIWTDKGLIYVAKMDSEGKLVLI